MSGELLHHVPGLDYRSFFNEPVDRAAAQRAVKARVGAIIEPRIQLQLKVQVVGERPARFKGALDKVLQTLGRAGGLLEKALSDHCP